MKRSSSDYAIWLSEILATALLIIVSVAALLGVCYSNEVTHPSIYWSIIVLIPVTVYYLAYRLVKNFYAFVGIHIVTLAVVCIICPDVYTKWIIGAVTVCLIFYSFFRKVKTEQTASQLPHFSLGAVFVVTYLVGNAVKVTEVKDISFNSLVIFAICMIIHVYINNIEFFFLHNSESTTLSREQMKLVNNGLIAFFIIAMTVVFFVIPHMHIQDIFMAIGSLLVALLRKLFSSINFNKVEKITEETYETEASEIYGMQIETSEFWQAFENIALMLIQTALIIAALACVGYAIYMLYKAFAKRNAESDKDEQEFLKPVSEAEYLSPFKRAKKRDSFFNLSNEAKIRKYYKRYVLKNAVDVKYLFNKTPAELPEAVDNMSSEPLKEVNDIYEKTRYSNREMTAADVTRIKEKLKKR